DRFFSIQKVLGVMHLLSGVFVFAAPFFAEGELVSTPLFLTMLFLHMLCYMPTVGLAMATSFHSLKDREKFPWIRVFGTLGWIGAGVFVSRVLHADGTAMPMYISGVAGVLMGLYSFTLPNIPPPAAGKKVSFRDIAGLDAIKYLGSRSFTVFILALLLTSIPLATYYAYVPVFVRSAGIADPAFKMTFGQWSEVVFLLTMPWIFIRLGVKRVLLIGMSAWAIRYGLFAIGASNAVTWMIMVGILLHGICYGFVYVAGQIYIDKRADRTIRAQAQGLFVLVTYGLGQGLGTLVAGWIFNGVVTGGSLDQWQIFWIIPLAFATLVTVMFALLFKDDLPVGRREAPA
ncbi:MAG TPA: MFS transporter, partial [Rhodothermales bacterium]|nr:MFS transporter [Rhodothermales bacterium]